MGKILKGLTIGMKVAAGISAGYFVLKATDKKANELVEEGNMLNAALIGAGQGALAVTAATLAYYLYGA